MSPGRAVAALTLLTTVGLWGCGVAPAPRPEAPACTGDPTSGAWRVPSADEAVVPLGGDHWRVRPAQLPEVSGPPARFLLVSGPDGKPQGHRLSAVADAGLATRLGLEVGDLITAVDGIALDSEAALIRALASVQEARHVGVAITRGDVVRCLRYELVR